MLERIRTLLDHLREVKEANALSDRDLDDLGMSRAQLLDFIDMPRDISDRVSAMAAIFGVPEADLKRNHAEWLDLLTTCGKCHERSVCAHALAHASEIAPSDCGFCGNHAAFEAHATRAA
jgi:Family of unknown function (DUF6455)